MKRRINASWVLVAAACSSSPVAEPRVAARVSPAASPQVQAPPGGALEAPTATAQDRERNAMAKTLADVAAAHGLTVLRPVPGQVVSRDQGIELIIAKTKRDVPAEVLAAQGEMFSALELIPADYPFVDGMFAMVKENIAGFYDPDADAMYLLDDLDDLARGPTLAHELVHALQDQHFDLGTRLTYRPGQVDALAALSCFAEGDATAAMFAGPDGSVAPLPVETLRLSMNASVALSAAGANTPPAMLASLVAPYIDGYRFVSALRERGGWAEVNQAWLRPPSSTEQVLHLDKYDANEAPLVVPPLKSAALGEGWRTLDEDAAGEQATRLTFEQWFTPPEASRAAAGWGGDRYALFARSATAGREVAFAWRIRFDSPTEAAEAEALMATKFPACRERATLGPLAWKRKAFDLAVVAGPFLRLANGGAATSPAARCGVARAWLAEVLASP